MSDLRRAEVLLRSNQPAAALPLFQAALRQSEQKPGGPSSAETAHILNGLGECCLLQDNDRAAAAYYCRAAAIRNYGFEGRSRAYLNAAIGLTNIGDHLGVGAQIASLISTIDAETIAGTTAPELLKRYRAMGSDVLAKSLQRVGRYSEVLPLLKENQAYFESIGDSERLADCLIGLGDIYLSQGLPDKALAVAQRAGSLNPSRKESLSHLSRLWTLVKRHDDALICAQKALELEERAHGNTTFNYAVLLEQVASVYDDLGQADVTLSWYHRAREGFEKVNATNTSAFAQLLLNMGVLYARSNNLSVALTHFTRAETIYRGVLPPDHPAITQCMRNIADANEQLGNTDAAASAAAVAASAARRSQVQCAGPACPRKIKADDSPLDQCGKCKRCYYCSKACQTAHWEAGHKAECKTLRSGK